MKPLSRVICKVLSGAALSGALALGAMNATAQRAAAPAVERAYAGAQLDYEASHWAKAHAAFAALADRGHADSARIALQMWRHGRALYGHDFKATPEQVQRWQRLMGCEATAAAPACVLAAAKP